MKTPEGRDVRVLVKASRFRALPHAGLSAFDPLSRSI